MKKIKAIFANAALKTAEKVAIQAGSSSSMYGYFQPKEPANLIIELKQKKRP
ncbi:MAG: cyclic lactone autoinducer peptide [Eubacterium sp.]|jgi:cyclic lactone autoinducer peptide|nr:cyclic lactone autoinducer peptide [Eubacterium sp.]